MNPYLRILVVAASAGAIVAAFLLLLWLVTRPKVPRRPWRYRGEHVGATEQWSPKREIRNAPPPPAVPTKVLLEEAEAEFIAAHDKVAKLRRAVADEEDDRYIRELRAISNTVTGQIQRVGQLESHTVEIDRKAFWAGLEAHSSSGAARPVGAGKR